MELWHPIHSSLSCKFLLNTARLSRSEQQQHQEGKKQMLSLVFEENVTYMERQQLFVSENVSGGGALFISHCGFF